MPARAAADPGVRPAALRALDATEGPSWRLSAFTIAGACMRLGEHDRALAWLERAYGVHDVRLPFAFYSPVFAPLRDDERFRALAAKLNVTPPGLPTV